MKNCIRILSLLVAVQAVTHANLVARWNMNETTLGSTIVDSVNGLVGTPTPYALSHDGLEYGQASVAAGAYGAITVTAADAAKFGASIRFIRNGSGMFQIGNPAVIDNLTSSGPGGAFTMMAWVNANISASTNQRIFATGPSNGHGLGLSNVDQVLFTAFGVEDCRSTTAPSSNNVWQHVAYTWNAGAIEVFINGSSVYTALVGGFNNETLTQFGIGGNGTGGDHFNGRIDELKIYDNVLSPAEIAAAALPTADIDPLLVVAPAVVFANNGAPQTFSIPFSNAGGSENLTVTSVTPGGFDEFSFTVNGFTASLAPGENGSIELGFTPISSGTYEAELLVVSNDSYTPEKTVKITVQVADPVFSMSADRVDFGDLVANPGPQTVTVTLTNEGGGTALNIYDTVFLGQGGNGFSVISAPDIIEPGESGDVVIGFDPGSSTGNFGDLLQIATNAFDTPIVVLPVMAKVASNPGAKPVTVVNGGFNAGGWTSSAGTEPEGWSTSLSATNTGGFYGQGELTPGLTSIAAHFQAIEGYYEQNLSANNSGLVAGVLDAVTVSFDRVYRNDAFTDGPALLRVSLWDVTNNMEIAGRDLSFEDPGVQAGNHFTPVAFRLSYDASTYGNEEIALRITRVPPMLPSNTNINRATLVIDNVSVSVDGAWEPADAFADWAQLAGLDGSLGKENGPNEDPDGDGVSNFEEFAFGGDPLSGGSGTLSAVATADNTGDSLSELILTVAVRSDANFAGSPTPTASASGVNYAIQGSFDLLGFNAAVDGPLVTAVLPASLPVDPPAGYKYVSFRLAGSNGLPDKGFLRARAEAP